MANEKLIPLSEVKKKITAVRQYFSGPPSTDQDKLARSVAELCLEEVGKIKPVDAVEVVHGRFEFACVHNGKKHYKCTNCHHAFPFANVNYCPNCGAKMDGERRTDG